MSIQAQTIEVGKIKEGSFANRVFYTRFFDNKTIAFSGPDSIIHFVDLSTLELSKEVKGFQGKPDAFEFSDDHEWLVSTSIDNEIACWDLKTSTIKYNLGEYSPGYASSKQIRFSPGNKSFAVSQNCYFPLWDLKDGKAKDTIPSMEKECAYVIAYTAKGERVYAGGNNNVWMYDLNSKQSGPAKNTSSISVVLDVALSPDNKLLAVSGREGLLLLNADLSDKFELKGHTDWINDLVFSPDGRTLYSSSGSTFGEDRSIRAWNTVNGECVKVMQGHTEDVDCIDVSPNGCFIVSASRDFTLKVWDAAIGKTLCTIVPLLINNQVKLFYYTPSGSFYGPDEFYSLVTIKRDGKEIPSDQLKSAGAKSAVIQALK
ncbi:MAG: WD40 repeat domain-containing protein [Cytophagaceae bacterium]